MSRNKLRSIFNSVGQDYNLRNFYAFQRAMAQPEKRKTFYETVSHDYDLGEFEQFDSLVASSLPETAVLERPEVEPPVEIQPQPAPTAEEKPVITAPPAAVKPAEKAPQKFPTAVRAFDIGAQHFIPETEKVEPEKPEFELPTISEAPEESLIKKILGQWEPTSTEKIAHAQNVYQIAKQYNLPISKVRHQIKLADRKGGMDSAVNSFFTSAIAFGMATHAPATLAGIGAFMAIKELVNAGVSIYKDEKYQALAGKGFSDLPSEESSHVLKKTIEAAELIGTISLMGAGIKMGKPTFEKFTKDIVVDNKAPQYLYIEPEQVKAATGEGKFVRNLDRPGVIARIKLLEWLGITGDKAKLAEENGVAVPVESVTWMVDKPWFHEIKNSFRLMPAKKAKLVDYKLKPVEGTPTSDIGEVGLAPELPAGLPEKPSAIPAKPVPVSEGRPAQPFTAQLAPEEVEKYERVRENIRALSEEQFTELHEANTEEAQEDPDNRDYQLIEQAFAEEAEARAAIPKTKLGKMMAAITDAGPGIEETPGVPMEAPEATKAEKPVEGAPEGEKIAEKPPEEFVEAKEEVMPGVPATEKDHPVVKSWLEQGWGVRSARNADEGKALLKAGYTQSVSIGGLYYKKPPVSPKVEKAEEKPISALAVEERRKAELTETEKKFAGALKKEEELEKEIKGEKQIVHKRYEKKTGTKDRWLVIDKAGKYLAGFNSQIEAENFIKQPPAKEIEDKETFIEESIKKEAQERLIEEGEMEKEIKVRKLRLEDIEDALYDAGWGITGASEKSEALYFEHERVYKRLRLANHSPVYVESLDAINISTFEPFGDADYDLNNVPSSELRKYIRNLTAKEIRSARKPVKPEAPVKPPEAAEGKKAKTEAGMRPEPKVLKESAPQPAKKAEEEAVPAVPVAPKVEKAEVAAEKPEVEELTAEKRAIIGTHVAELGSIEKVAEYYPGKGKPDTFARERAEELFGEEAAPKKEAAQEAFLDESEFPVQRVSVKDIRVSPEDFQFKRDVDERGIQEGTEIKGEFRPLAAGNVLVWQAKDGTMFVVNGHHRLAKAQDEGLSYINAQIIKETDGYTKDQAKTLGALTNIEEGRGTSYDWVEFFKETDISETQSRKYGLEGQAFRFTEIAGNDLLASFRNRHITPEQAFTIAETAGKDEAVQAIGMRLIQTAKEKGQKLSPDDLANQIRANIFMKENAPELKAQRDLFGETHDAALELSENLAKITTKHQKELKEIILALRNVNKDNRLEIMKKTGLEFESVAEARKVLEKAKADLAKWQRWELDPDLRKIILSELNKQGTQKGLFEEAKPEAEEIQFITRPVTIAARPGMGLVRVERALAGIKDKFKIPIRVLGSVEDLEGRTREAAQNELKRGNVISGFYNPRANEIVILADGVRNSDELLKLIIPHEITHYGTKGMLGEKAYVGLLKDLQEDKAIGPEIRKLMKENGWKADYAASEWWAGNAEGVNFDSLKKPSLIQRVIFYLKKWLRKVFGAKRVKFSDAEIKDLLRQSYQYARREEGKRAVNEFAVELSYSLKEARTKITDNPNFKKWFGDSKVVDEKGKPLVVYHSTDAKEINVFDQAWNFARIIYFGFTPQAARQAARGKKNIIGVYLNVSNPYNTKETAIPWYEAEDHLFIADLKRKGYDGIYIKDESGISIAVFEPTQIKSIYNVGTFSPETADIRFRTQKLSDLRSQMDELTEALEKLPEIRSGLSTKNIRARMEQKIAELDERIREAELGMAVSFRTRPTTDRQARLLGLLEPTGGQPVERTGFKFLNPEVEERFSRAKGGAKDPYFVRIKANIKNLWNKMAREYEHLPKTEEFAQLRFDILKLTKQRGISSDKTLREIADIIKNLDKTDYDLFTRKVILDDFSAMLDEDPDVALPFGLTKDNFNGEYERLNSVVGKIKVINDSIEKRNKTWESVKADYIKSMRDIGFDVEDRLTRKNYFRHQVLDYIRLKNAVGGTGRKLKTPAYRGFLKGRKGSQLDINTDYLQAEHEVMAQMLYDMEVAKTIKAVDENYNIKDRLKKEALEQSQGYEKAKPGTQLEYQSITWEDIIPEGYVEWQPREGNVFYMADAIPAVLAKRLTEGAIERLGISKDDINKALVLGGKRRSFVIREEIAETLDGLTKEKSASAIGDFDKKVLRYWKVWQLISPRRFFKYNLRNLTGDSDAVFCGNPAVFKRIPQACRELISAYNPKEKLSGNVKDWFERGGTITTMQAQEMGELNRLSAFIDKYEKKGITDIPTKIWHKYWKTARLTTDFRESILRYAAYLDYLEKIEKGVGKKLKNYGASIPKEIDGLKDPKDKAFWLSNDLLGAYDRVGVLGQHIREHIFPFWSWKEVNTKRYVRMFRNAASNGEFATAVGRKLAGTAVRSPYMLWRIGKFAIMASGFFAVAQIWNNLIFPDEEDDLPEDTRNKPHIVFGRDSEGNVLYFSRIGALGDLLEWLNLDASPYYVNEMFKGKMSIKDVAKDMAKAPINILTQGAFPFIKLAGELATRRALFPDIFKPGTVRDRGFHIARSFGLENEYIALRKLPSRGYEETKGKFFYYKTNPLESAYWNIQDEKRRFLSKKGETYTGFWITPRGNALYNLKLAFKMGDREAVDKYLEAYALLGGTGEGFTRSTNAMEPMNGLKDAYETEFLKSLDEEDKEQLKKATGFYNEFLTKIKTYEPSPELIKRLGRAKTAEFTGAIHRESILDEWESYYALPKNARSTEKIEELREAYREYNKKAKDTGQKLITRQLLRNASRRGQESRRKAG